MQEKIRKSLGFRKGVIMGRVQDDIKEIILRENLFSELQGKKILVTGATGLIGSMVVKTLLYANKEHNLKIEIIGQIRNTEKAKLIYGDLFEAISFIHDVNIKCDFIVHTVLPTTSRFFIEHPVETIRTSVSSTMDVLEVARSNNANMVYLSSMEQYGIPYESGQIMTEDKVGIIDHLNVRSSYSESKRLCECLCASYSEEYGVNVKIARLAQTFGAGIPSSDNRMPIQFAKSVVEGKDIVLHTEGKSVSNFVYLTDAITGIFVMLSKGISGQAYNICNDNETRSVREIADLVANEVAKGNIRVLVEKKENMGYAPDVNMYLNSEKLQSLGWSPYVGMKDAYLRLVQYLEEGR